MDERVVKFRVGVMVLSTIIIAAILVLLFGDARSMLRGNYTVYMHFSDAPGVSEGTPVRKSGILIGRVSSVRFADQGGVVVTAGIYGNVKLYRSEIPQVTGSILGGDVVIQFVKRAKPPASEKPAAAPQTEGNNMGASASPEGALTAAVADEPPASPTPAASKTPAENPNDLIRDGDYIEGSVAPNAFQVISNLEDEMGNAIGSLANAGNEVGKLAGYVNKILESNDAQVNRIINKTEQTLDSFQRALSNIEDVLGNDEVRDNLKRSIAGLPDLLADTRSAMNTMRTTVESVDRNMRNLEGFTGPLGERGDQIVERVDQAVSRLDELLGELSDFGRKLNRGEGSLGQLMRNPDLYQHLNGAAKNIEQITCELKPILADARVFSDKIARHPELLGVRGAIQKSPGTK
jgi:phospholipid/cholesterol/gamma-HCH transport system substrate-binding protein